MAIAAPTSTPTPAAALPKTATPGGPSPVVYNGNAQPTLPEGSVVDNGSGPQVTPPSDTVLYTRVGNDAPPIAAPTPTANTQPYQTELSSLVQGAEEAVTNVTNQFATKVQQFNSGGGANNVGMRNALAASSGLSGGSGGQDQESAAGTVNKKTTDALNTQKENQINAIYANLSKNQAALSNSATKTDTSNNATYTKQTSAEAKTALTDISGVLGNLSFQQFKTADPQTYQSILNMSGGSDAELELLYNNAMSSSANKPTYHWESGQAFEQIGGNIVRRPDLDTTTPSASTGSTKLQVIGGTAYLFPVDSSGKTTIDPTKPLSYYAYATVPKTTAAPKPKTPATALTGSDYTKLNSAGVNQQTADALTAAILGGESLEDIRTDLKNENLDPGILDTYDRTVGIAKLLKTQKSSSASGSGASASSTPVVVPGVSQ